MAKPIPFDDPPPLSELGQRTSPPPISWLMREALRQPDLISLAAGFTDNKTLPRKATKDLLEEILGQPKTGQQWLQYGTAEGNERLRHLTAQQLYSLDRGEQDSAHIHADDIFVTNGSQQFLYLISEALCDPGDLVIVEDPTYFVYLGILQSRGVNARGIAMESDGYSLASLEATLEGLTRTKEIKRLKFIYLVTYFQNPTGITTSAAKKHAALELLRRYEKKAGHPIYLVEDAAYRELNFPHYQAPSSSLVHSDYRDRIIYTGTFSKPFATGIRVGFGILPDSLREPVASIKGNHDFGTAHLLQGILAAAMERGDYAAQLKRSRRKYEGKCQAMLEAMNLHFPDQVEFTTPQGGLCLWATLPKRITTGKISAFFKAALASGVLYVPGEFAYADDPTRPKPKSGMRLSFGSASRENITLGIQRLGEVMHQRIN